MLWTLITALATSNGTPEACNGIDDDENGRVDDGAVCAGCRVLGYAGSAYLVCPDEVADRAAAATLCQGFGYHLVDVQSEEEHAFLIEELDLLTIYWTGLTDSEPNAYKWSDGSNAGYIPWTPGQPDDLTGTENCAWYIAVSGAQEHGLNDVPCTATGAGAVCESGPSPFELCDTSEPPEETADTGEPPRTPPAGHVICACRSGASAGWPLGWGAILAISAVRRRRPRHR